MCVLYQVFAHLDLLACILFEYIYIYTVYFFLLFAFLIEKHTSILGWSSPNASGRGSTWDVKRPQRYADVGAARCAAPCVGAVICRWGKRTATSIAGRSNSWWQVSVVSNSPTGMSQIFFWNWVVTSVYPLYKWVISQLTHHLLTFWDILV